MSGQVSFRWPDHAESYVAVDTYQTTPADLSLLAGGTSLVEFSPTGGLVATMAVFEANLAAAGDQSLPPPRARSRPTAGRASTGSSCSSRRGRPTGCSHPTSSPTSHFRTGG